MGFLLVAVVALGCLVWRAEQPVQLTRGGFDPPGIAIALVLIICGTAGLAAVTGG